MRMLSTEQQKPTEVTDLDAKGVRSVDNFSFWRTTTHTPLVSQECERLAQRFAERLQTGKEISKFGNLRESPRQERASLAYSSGTKGVHDGSSFNSCRGNYALCAKTDHLDLLPAAL